jgi:integrase
MPERHRQADQPEQPPHPFLPGGPRKGCVSRIRFHDLRHTAATLMLGRGVHPKIVSEMLGHSTVTITLDLYSHVTPTMQQQAADGLDDLLSAPLAVNLAVSEDDEGSKPQVSPRSSGDRASVS